MKKQNYDKARVHNLMQAEMAARTAFGHGYEPAEIAPKKRGAPSRMPAVLSRLLSLRPLRSAFTNL